MAIEKLKSNYKAQK